MSNSPDQNAHHDGPGRADSYSSDRFLVPAVARLQDFLDGGSDNYFIDQALGTKLRDLAYWLPDSVRINRAHGPRILSYVSGRLGIDQVIDLGCGLPHDDNRQLPDVVRRIVYVDSDPLVEGHARMVLAERTATVSLLADLTNMSGLLAAPAIAQLDRERPIAVLLHDVLPYLGDDDAHTVLETLNDWLPAGSVLSLTHATADFAPEALMEEMVERYADAGIDYRPRTAAQLQALLGAWAVLDGGELVTTAEWHSPSTYARLDQSHAYAALAAPAKPGTASPPVT